MAFSVCWRSKEEERYSQRLLVEASANGDIRTVTKLLKLKVNVDAEDYNRTLYYASKDFKTPLHMACTNGHLCCTDVLIANGADVNAKDNWGATAIHMAAENGHLSCLKALLNAHVECSHPTKKTNVKFEPFEERRPAFPYPRGTTPLHLAAANNHVECIKELIQYGADYNAIDEWGRTSLYIAAQYGHSDSLLTHLRNATGRDILSLPGIFTGETPLHFAVQQCMLECIEELATAITCQI